MLKALIPSNEAQRQLNLLSYGILDTSEEEDYNIMVELAANICNCPISMVTFIDGDRQWFKASKNVDRKESPRETSFCGHAILMDDIMVIHDAVKDERFADNPDVTGGLKIGFYAGAPIISAEGYHLGTVCVIDNDPKTFFSDNQKKSLKALSTQVTRLLELRLKSNIIMDQAEQLLQKEKSIARTNMVNREKENDYIAWQLHENIAQILAAAKMNVETMGITGTYNPSMISDLRNYLVMMMDHVKTLSYSITPTTLKSADYTEFIFEMIDAFGRKNDMEISLLKENSSLKLNATLGLTIYRIIQYQLDYAKMAGAKKVEFELNTNAENFLVFKHDGNGHAELPEEAAILLNNISTRAEIINAAYAHYPEKNLVEISLMEGD
ncbi:GAF domain-containing sensor histidine kinase [Ferruginibacter sp. HRS2-29]|uniref:sensor histidine kinase n=1 Tax=Ferruginibacter sp. HRS2-29 TaxID=2487334 RepID=UPI0020CD518E|nr:GAF domain-containing protein [Ferruginibacter sp. HRS2-29]MCP9753123.1 GAF domain-containing protein [Ferruginibacter sp. HRS2-29]